MSAPRDHVFVSGLKIDVTLMPMCVALVLAADHEHATVGERHLRRAVHVTERRRGWPRAGP